MSDEKQAIDVEAVLQILAEADQLVESALTGEERAALAVLRRQVEQHEGVVYAAGEDAVAVEDFDLLTTADALESLAGKVRAVVQMKEAKLYQDALSVYYATEELSREPQNAHLAENVKRMREAHERQYGKPIPPKKEQ